MVQLTKTVWKFSQQEITKNKDTLIGNRLNQDICLISFRRGFGETEPADKKVGQLSAEWVSAVSCQFLAVSCYLSAVIFQLLAEWLFETGMLHHQITCWENSHKVHQYKGFLKFYCRFIIDFPPFSWKYDTVI